MSLKIKVNETNVNESYVDRIISWMHKYACATITAYRNTLTNLTGREAPSVKAYLESEEYKELGFVPKVVKRAWNRELKSTLLKLGYWVTPIKGAYREAGWDKSSDEESFFVVCPEREDDFLMNIRKLGEAYNQDSILFKDYGSMDAYLWGTNYAPADKYNPGYGKSKLVGHVEKCIPVETIGSYSAIRGGGFVFKKDVPETFYGLQNTAKASAAKESESVLKAMGITRTRSLDEYRKLFYESRK